MIAKIAAGFATGSILIGAGIGYGTIEEKIAEGKRDTILILEAIDKGFDKVEKRFDGVDKNFNTHKEIIDSLLIRDARQELRLQTLEKRK